MGWEEIRNELLFHVRWAGKSSLRNSVWAEPEAVRERVDLWGETSRHTLCTKQAWAGWTVCVPGVCWSPGVGTKYHTPEGLKQQSLILYTSGAGSPRSRYEQGQAPSAVLAEWMPACLRLAFGAGPYSCCFAALLRFMPPTPRSLFLSLCFCLYLLSSCRDTNHIGLGHILVVCCSVAKSYPAFCDSMYCSTPGFPVLHYLQEFAQTLVHWVGDAIQPSHLDVKLITSMKTLFLKWVNFQRYLGLGFQCIFGRAKLNPWPCLNKECGWNLGKEWRREGDESSRWVSGVGSCRLGVSKALLSEKRNLGPAVGQGILGSSTFQ